MWGDRKPTNSDVIDAFIEGRAARTANLRSEAIKDKTCVLYSYEEPIALITPSGVVYVANTASMERSSVTMSKHRNMVIKACGRADRYYDYPTYTSDLHYLIKVV